MSLFHINLSNPRGCAPASRDATLAPVPDDLELDPLLAAIIDAGKSCQAEARQLWACDPTRIKETRRCDRDAVHAARQLVDLENPAPVSSGMLKMVEILASLRLATKEQWAGLGVVRGPLSGDARDARRTTNVLCTAHLCEFPGSFWVAALFCAAGMRVNWVMNSLQPGDAGATADFHGFLRTEKSRRRCVVEPDGGDILSPQLREALLRQAESAWGAPRAAGLVTADGFPNRVSAGLHKWGKAEQEDYYARQGGFMLEVAAAEASAAVALLAPKGVLILKAIDVFAWEFIAFLERLRLCFSEAHLIKPALSAPENSEVYFVGVGFLARQADYDWAASLPCGLEIPCTAFPRRVPLSMLRRPGQPMEAPGWAEELLRLHARQISALRAHRARARDPNAGIVPYPLPADLPGWLAGVEPVLRARPADAVDAPRKMLNCRRPYRPGDKKHTQRQWRADRQQKRK